MWKETINTIKKNPRMLWAFTIPVILTLILAFPMYRSIALTLLGNYTWIEDVPNFTEIIRSYTVVLPIAYILIGVFVLPPLYAYVYEVVTGKKKNIWTKTGFLKYSWRVIAMNLFAFLILFAFFVMLFFLFIVPTLGFTVYTIAISACGVFLIISLTSAIAEDRFIDSLPNTFFIGHRYFIKMYLTSTVIMMPSIAVSTWYIVYLHKVGMDMAYAIPTINMPPKLTVFIFLSIVFLLSVYYVFAQAFLVIYSMHHYITEKAKLELEDKITDSMEQNCVKTCR